MYFELLAFMVLTAAAAVTLVRIAASGAVLSTTAQRLAMYAHNIPPQPTPTESRKCTMISCKYVLYYSAYNVTTWNRVELLAPIETFGNNSVNMHTLVLLLPFQLQRQYTVYSVTVQFFINILEIITHSPSIKLSLPLISLIFILSDLLLLITSMIWFTNKLS